MANQTSLHMRDLTYFHQAPKVPALRNNCFLSLLHPSLSLPLSLSQGQGNLVIKLLHQNTPLASTGCPLVNKRLHHRSPAPTPLHSYKSLHMLCYPQRHTIVCQSVFLRAELLMPAQSQLKPSVLCHGCKEQHWRSKTNVRLFNRMDHFKSSARLQQWNTWLTKIWIRERDMLKC